MGIAVNVLYFIGSDSSIITTCIVPLLLVAFGFLRDGIVSTRASAVHTKSYFFL